MIKQMDDIKGIKVRRDVVIVKPTEQGEIGGILLPQSSQESGQTGVVCAVGPGTEETRMEVKPGDKVFHCKWAGSEVKIEENKYMIMKQEDVLARFTGERKIDLLPLEDRILIEWERGDDFYKGTKIARAEGTAKERYYTGIVVVMGDKAVKNQEEVEEDKKLKIGDRVFFDQFCGPERIDFEEKRYALIWEHSIYCKVPLRKSMMILSH